MSVNGNFNLGRKGKQGQVDVNQLKGGIRREQIKDEKQLAIFDKYAGADGILVDKELQNFKKELADMAKNETLSKREAKKFLKGQELQNISADDLFQFLENIESISAQSNVESAKTGKDANGNDVVILTSNNGMTTETISADKSSVINTQLEDGGVLTQSYDSAHHLTKEVEIDPQSNITTTSYQTNDAGEDVPLSRFETSADGTKKRTTNFDEQGNPTDVTVQNGTTVEEYDITSDDESVLAARTEHKGLATEKKTTFKYQENGDIIETATDANGTTQTVVKDGKPVLIKTANSVTEITYSENGKVETTTDNNTNAKTVTAFDEEGDRLSQQKEVDGKTYRAEYDGNGNTKGVVVQNGESPALIAKRFGCKLEDLIAANPDAIKGKAPNQYFLVGADIVIPGEMNAEKFAQINTGRQTKEEAVGKYTQFVQAQQAQIEAEDAELAARKNHRRSFLEQKWNTFEECAIAYYKREGVTNPTKRQIELRIKELQELNPNLKDGEIKGKKIIATFSPETDAQIGAGQQRREATRMEQKRKAETATGKTMAQVMYNAIDDHVGGVSESDFQANLKKVSADNVVGLLKQYNEISPDETLIEAIMDETWNSLDTRRNAINKIVNALIQRAENANVSDERQKQAIEACKQELNSYWSLGIGYCQTSKLDGLINNLIGTIDAAEALTNEEKSQMSGTGIDETLNLMNTQVSENTSALNAQLAEDGWCADLYEGLKWYVGSDNLDENVKADLKKYEGYITELQKAEQAGGEAGFKAKFKEIFGVDYDPNLMKGYNKLQSNFAMAQGLTMQKEGFYSEFGSCINGQEDYSSMRTKYGQYLAQIAQAEGQNIDANIALDNVIATQLQKQGLDINTATDAQKRQALKTVISDTYNAIDAELNKFTQGRSLFNMEKQLKNAGSAVFGNKNDIAFRINDYISSQQQGGAAVNMAIKAAGAIVVGTATGGAGFAALATASLVTAAISAGVDLTDRVSSEIGLKEGEISNILKNATIDGASVFAGGMVGKYAAMFKNANSFVQAGGKLSMMMAGDVATGAAAEYLQTGTITLEGVAFQAVFSAAGNLVSLKQLADTDVTTTTSGDTQQVRVSKGVKGDVNNHRDMIADGEVARNADQSHLKANERQIVEQELKDIPTADELARYQKENGYQPVPDADKPAYQRHQEQVATDYANAHRVENNAVTTKQKAPTVPKEAIDNLNDEIRDIDSSIRRLKQQLAGAKRANQMGRKNGDTIKKLESQIESLQQKQATKMAELEAMQKPKVEVVSDNADIETPKQTIETSEIKPSAEIKQDVTPESVRQSTKNISDAEIPIEHKGLWKDCKSRINSITDELKNFKGDIQAMLLKCENLFADLKVIASKATVSVKNKIEQLIEDLRSMLTPKNLPNVDEALTPSVTSQHRMEMGQIGSSIPRAKNLDDLNKLQTWLDQMPESSQKTHLQNQLNAKYAEIFAPKVKVSQIADYSNSKQGTRLPKNKPVTLQGSETLRLANYDLDLSSPEIQSKLNAMKDGDVITVGRNATGANDIKIDGSFTTVSGKHLQIEKVGNRFAVIDLSTNGTVIGKSIAHVSGEIKTTFGHQTVNNLADLKPGQTTSIVKGDIKYTIENNNGQIKITSRAKLSPTLNKAIKFDEIRMSNRTPNGKANPGKTMGELLTPQQKKVYSDSMDAFERSKNKKIVHNANNVLTTDNMLHGTDLDALLSNGGILDNGLVPREISGNSAAHFTNGSVPDTLTPLCSDVWDIRQNATIKDYFDANNSHWNNYGESNFLPKSDKMAAPVVIVFDKKSIDPTIIDNSFGVNNSGKSILFENGNMSRGHNYPTHRAIPIGAPANSIDRIIIDTRRISSTEVQALRQKINSLGLDVKLYDLNGNLLS